MVFDFEIFLDSEYIKNLSQDDERAIKTIQDEFGIKRIEFDHDHMIPGLAGSVIKIQDNSYSAKHDALQAILKAAFHDHQRDSLKNHSLTILVPEGMVSLLIGARGKQINNIMRDSKTHIIVNPAIQNMTYRTVHIDGTMHHICHACEIIYRTLEDVSPNVENIEKLPEPLELHKTKLIAKIIFPKSSVGFIIGKEGGWIKELCEKHYISIKFQQDFSIRCVKKDEAVCLLNGSLADVIDSITILLKRFHEFENVSKHYAYDVVKLLIPNTYVTKLIGAKGCMIREIAAKAGGAQIKILSDKQSEREVQECLVTIAGSLANKQDAVCTILEQIEIFKHGGPILINGKTINENPALQSRNSIPPRDSPTRENYHNGHHENGHHDSHHEENDSKGHHANGIGADSHKHDYQDKGDDLENDIPDEFLHEKTPTPELKREMSKDHDDTGDCDFEYSVEESVDNHYRRKYSRSRSRSGHRKIVPKNSSRSRSMERRPHDSHNTHDDKYKIKKRSQSPHKGAGNERRDVTRNSHFLDPKGDLKITISSLVPNYLVPYIIGKNGEVIRSIETKTSCSVSFQKETKHDHNVINTAEGIRARICSLVGTPNSVKEAFGLLIEEIVKLEKNINGVRSEDN